MKKIDFGSNEDFIKNYNELKSSRKMGELYGCSKGAVANHAKSIGYDVSNNQKKKKDDFNLKDIIAEYERTKSCEEVGRKFGCSGKTIIKYLKDNNYDILPPKKKTILNLSITEFDTMYKEYGSLEKMAKPLGCSKRTLSNYAKEIGYKFPTHGRTPRLTPAEKQEILDAYYTSSSNELAQKYGVTRGIITKLWHDAHLTNKTVSNPKTTEINLKGQRFGKWTVQYKVPKRGASGIIYWHCVCDCGVERDVSGLSLRNGSSLSCGNHSNISKGNEKISKILNEAKIPFETEKKFPSCKDKKELPFDFYVNNKYLIEYDGIQHYKETIFDLEYTQSHDHIKTEWCKNNKIPLIRIPYSHYENLCLNDLLLETSEFIV